MSSQSASDHPGTERLVDLLHGQLAEDEARAVEEHLAECDACVDLARRVRTVSRMIDEWTAVAHGVAARQAQLARAVLLEAERQVDPRLGARLRAWADRFAGRAASAVRLVFEAPGRVHFITEGLEALLVPGGFGPFGPPTAVTAGGVVPTRGSVDTRGAVRTRGPVRARGGAGAPGGGPQGQAAVAVETSGDSPARVVVAGDVVDVHVREWSEHQDPPLVMLVPGGEAGAPRVAALVRLRGTHELTARFEGVGPGDYLVAIEPIQDPAAPNETGSKEPRHG
jgi:hypothetical protein